MLHYSSGKTEITVVYVLMQYRQFGKCVLKVKSICMINTNSYIAYASIIYANKD